MVNLQKLKLKYTKLIDKLNIENDNYESWYIMHNHYYRWIDALLISGRTLLENGELDDIVFEYKMDVLYKIDLHYFTQILDIGELATLALLDTKFVQGVDGFGAKLRDNTAYTEMDDEDVDFFNYGEEDIQGFEYYLGEPINTKIIPIKRAINLLIFLHNFYYSIGQLEINADDSYYEAIKEEFLRVEGLIDEREADELDGNLRFTEGIYYGGLRFVSSIIDVVGIEKIYTLMADSSILDGDIIGIDHHKELYKQLSDNYTTNSKIRKAKMLGIKLDENDLRINVLIAYLRVHNIISGGTDKNAALALDNYYRKMWRYENERINNK